MIYFVEFNILCDNRKNPMLCLYISGENQAKLSTLHQFRDHRDTNSSKSPIYR